MKKRRWFYGLLAATVLTVSLSVLLPHLLPPLQLPEPAYSFQLTDRDGELLRLYTTDDGYWRLPADADRIDPRFIQQLLAYEDKRFEDHGGVDPLALARAGWQWLRHGRIVSGASTLTMQTVRLLEPRPRTLGSKLTEMWLARRLEQQLSKKQILDLYLTLAPYGGNLQGIRAASLFYFGKEPDQLTPSQSALLIALPQSPESRRPDRHPEAAGQARHAVLEQMHRKGLLSDEEVELAHSIPVPVERRPTPFLAPHLADRLKRDSDQALLKTTLDISLQRRLETLARRHQETLPDGQTLAVMIVSNKEREVLAHLGSGDYFNATQIDLTQSIRSPGSTLKPLIYGLGFEALIFHPETRVLDQPFRRGAFGPRNFDQAYRGVVSVRQALQKSLNVPAVKALQQVGPSRLVNRLDQVGVNLALADRQKPGLSIALGGAGTRLHDLTALYAAIANGGNYRALGYVVDEERGNATRLLSGEASWYLDDILSGVPLPRGFTRNLAVRFKTGTSYGFRDVWAIGYDADYTIGVWVGQVDGSAGHGQTGLDTAAPLLLEAFELMPPGAPVQSDPPDDVLLVKNSELPRSMRWLSDDDKARYEAATNPQIIFPVDGSTMTFVSHEQNNAGITLKSRGGAVPYHWLIDGRRIDQTGFEQTVQWQPEGPGRIQITLIDSEGQSDRVEVWLEHE